MRFNDAMTAANRQPTSGYDLRNYRPAEQKDFLAQYYETVLKEKGYDDREPKNFAVISRFMAAHRTRALGKGLCIVGGNGRGKSMCTRIMARRRGFKFREAVEFNERWQSVEDRRDFWDWLEGSSQSPSGNDLVIDDMGRENKLNNFGTIETVMDRILEHRVQLLCRIGALTVITTNCWVECPTANGKPIPREEREYPTILEKYGPAGERIKSRLYELCHIVRFTGPDQRKEK